jgi:hypothetical protein
MTTGFYAEVAFFAGGLGAAGPPSGEREGQSRLADHTHSEEGGSARGGVTSHDFGGAAHPSARAQLSSVLHLSPCFPPTPHAQPLERACHKISTGGVLQVKVPTRAAPMSGGASLSCSSSWIAALIYSSVYGWVSTFACSDNSRSSISSIVSPSDSICPSSIAFTVFDWVRFH